MKNRAYALINILGLAIGMAACLMILLFVRYELSFDRWLPNSENIYQLQTWYHDHQTGEDQNLQMAAYAAGSALKKDYPQVERMVYVSAGGFTVIRNGEAIAVDNGSLVSGPFFDIFQFPLVKGDPRTALKDVGSVALSESQAQKLFGSEDPIGKTLTVMLRGKPVDHRVTAVFKDLPKNSHMKFNMVARYDPVTYWAEQTEFLTQWGWQSGWWYAALKPGSDPKVIAADEKAWEKRNIPDETFGDRKYNQGDDSDYHLVNVRDVHLGKAQNGASTPGNDRRTILTFGVIALLILGMACVNFTNLSTARASQRAREVALRKVLGAARPQLIVQFVGESIIVATIAMMVALALVELLAPGFSRFLDADLDLHYFGRDGILLPVFALVLLVGLLGGLYPAFFLSRFQPSAVLKANRSAAETPGSGRLRNILVVGQFAVSIGLIICTAIVYTQTVYARTTDPGYQREGLLQLTGAARRQIVPLSDTLVAEISRVNGVKSVGRSSIGIATTNSSNTGISVPGKAEAVTLGTYSVDTKFFDTMGIKLIAGRSFDTARPMDDATLPFPEDKAAEQAFVARGANVVINELGAKRLGFRNPADAVGKQFKGGGFGTPDELGLVPINIIGVVQDSRFRSIREPLEPIMFRYAKNNLDAILVRYSSANPDKVRSDVEQVWKRIVSDAPFDAKFSEDIIEKLYKAEDARAKTFAGFAVLAVIVGCLGLFGLATFTAERRTKEIGIRKVMGARSRDIVRLLVWQFTRPVIIANLIAWPIAWYVMRDWLNTFDDRIALGPTPFLAAGLLALLIAIGTIAVHAIRVASANPIRALRYE
ncbi:ABC transporter permease [Sphingomonas tabacisoli]|uniref:ABC transporter permease n=1 Tax=Sphingomonas tabacisoli TaxID=2249466 RepID=A0ABW4I1S3_9SPHN